MEIYIKGKKIKLSQNDFVAKGGEGKVFKRGKIAYKIYNDLTKMIPFAKIKELEVCDHPSILRPKDIIINGKKQNVGFTMDWLGENVHPLCKLFTTAFRERNAIENEMIIELVENIKKLNQFVHDKKCLIVDGNELNYLINDDFVSPYMIDVNSWKTPSYPATAIMPSIRDWSTNEFSPLTDWFSFAIISFQLFIGIHPFKGKHVSYRRNDFQNRIKDGVSVFNPKVTLPPSTRDFNLIPGAYKDWFYKIFENKDRLPPPVMPGTTEIIQVAVKIVQSSDGFIIKMISEVDEQILYHNPELNITKTKNKIYIGRTDYDVSATTEILFTTLEQLPILTKIENNRIKFKCLTTGYTLKEIDLAASDMMIVDNRLYIKSNEKLIEMDFKVLETNIIPVVKVTWKIEALSSILYSNVIYQNLLGNSHICIPIPSKTGRSSFYNIAVPEIDNYRVIEAKYQNKICMMVLHDGNNYNKAIFVFNDSFSKYTFRMIKNIDYSPLNFTVLDNGVCVSIIEDNKVELMFNIIDKKDCTEIEDNIIDSNMKLCKDGNTVKFYNDKQIYSLKMKGK